MSQDAFAQTLGVRGGKAVISNWENGHSACEGPAAELLLHLYVGTPVRFSTMAFAQEVDALWNRAGAALPTYRQILAVPETPTRIAPEVFPALFPDVAIPSEEHQHGFPFIDAGLPPGVYGVAPSGWFGSIPRERDRAPLYLWLLKDHAQFGFRERVWEEDTLHNQGGLQGHTHVGSLLTLSLCTTFFLARLAARCGFDQNLRYALRYDQRGMRDRGIMSFARGAPLGEVLEGPGTLCRQDELSASVSASVGELLDRPDAVALNLVRESVYMLRPDLASDAELRAQLKARLAVDETSRRPLLGFVPREPPRPTSAASRGAGRRNRL